MRWLAKKFFWSFVFSATLLVVTSFVPALRERQKQTFRIVHLFIGSFKNPEMKLQLQQELIQMAQQEQLPGSFEFRHGEEINAQNLNAEPMQRALANTVSNDSTKAIGSPSSIDDNLVVIQGQTFRKSADNIYVVNGERIFYKKRSPADEEDAEIKKKAAEDNPVTQTYDIPTSPSELMDALKDAQSNLQRRDKYLQEIMNE